MTDSDENTQLHLSIVELLKTAQDGEIKHRTINADGDAETFDITLAESLPEVVDAVENDPFLQDYIKREREDEPVPPFGITD